jgi:hypothetical protein
VCNGRDVNPCLYAHHGVLKNSSKVIDLHAPFSNTTPRWGSSDAIPKHESDCGCSRHQPIFLLFCFVALMCCYLSLDNFCHLDWRCRKLFIFLNLHSPHPSPGCAVSRVKLWMKSPTLCFPVTTQITVVEKVLVSAPRTS